MRERENEMGVKGNEIERNIFSTSPNQEEKTETKKQNRERHLRSVVKDKTSFFLSRLLDLVRLMRGEESSSSRPVPQALLS